MEIFEDLVDAIGNTPLVRLGRIHPPGNLVGKVEYMNPGGSVKDRIALGMIERAERLGLLGPGGTIVEPTSGNTGLGLAMVAALRGYRLICVVPDKVSEEKIRLLEAYGAEVRVCPTEVRPDDPRSYYSVARRLVEEIPGAYRPDQYSNPANAEAHYRTTGPEIWADVPEITHFVAGLGTSGTLMGVGRFLKEQDPNIKVIAIEPPLGERVEGLRNLDEGYIPPVFEKWGGAELLDRKRIVRPRESIEWTRKLSTIGIFSGISAGAALAGAAKVASEIDEGTIVFVVCDYGWKYISTGAWTDDLDQVVERAEKIIYF